MKIIKKLLIVASFLICSISVFAETGIVKKVIDGDTVWVEKTNKTSFKIRLRYADAPEICQDYGQESKAALEAIVLNKTIDFKLNGKSYDRSVGFISVNGMDASQEMIRTGNAWLSKNGLSKKNPLRVIEDTAKLNKVGVWSNPNVIDPKVFRKTKKCGYKK